MDKNNIDVLILALGRKLIEDNKPSPMMLERLQKSKEIYLQSKEKFNTLIIVSGKGNGKTLECDVMKDWLDENGIDPNNVMVEPKSMNTIENVVYTLKMIYKSDLSKNFKSLKKIYIVTSDHHWVRSRSIFTSFFFKWRRHIGNAEINLVSCETLSTDKNVVEEEWKAEERGRQFLLLTEGYHEEIPHEDIYKKQYEKLMNSIKHFPERNYFTNILPFHVENERMSVHHSSLRKFISENKNVVWSRSFVFDKQTNEFLDENFFIDIFEKQNIEVIFCSPLTRSLETVTHLQKFFRENLSEEKKNFTFPKIVCIPFIRESLLTPQDTGLPKDDLVKKFSDIDFSLLHHFYWFEAHSNNKFDNIQKNPKVNQEPDFFVKMRAHNFLFYLSYVVSQRNLFVFSHKHFLRRVLKRDFERRQVVFTKDILN